MSIETQSFAIIDFSHYSYSLGTQMLRKRKKRMKIDYCRKRQSRVSIRIRTKHLRVIAYIHDGEKKMLVQWLRSNSDTAVKSGISRIFPTYNLKLL